MIFSLGAVHQQGICDIMNLKLATNHSREDYRTAASHLEAARAVPLFSWETPQVLAASSVCHETFEIFRSREISYSTNLIWSLVIEHLACWASDLQTCRTRRGNDNLNRDTLVAA